jgi:hypothetical protein
MWAGWIVTFTTDQRLLLGGEQGDPKGAMARRNA